LQSESTTLSDPQTFLAKAGQGHSISEYGAGDVVFSQGDQAAEVFFVEQGRVTITVVSGRGKEAVVGILATGHFLGEAVLTGQQVRVSTATVLEKSRIARILKSAMVRALHDEPAFSEFFIAHLLSRNLRIEEDLVDQLFNSTEKRLARTLLLLARYGEPQASHRALPKLSQEVLAEMVGTTRSRVNFFMNKFRKLGFIDYNGALKINNSLLSVVLRD